MSSNGNVLRELNRRQVLQTLLRAGPLTRAGLSRTTGLSAPTVGRIVEQLVAEHVLKDQDTDAARPAKASAGRPSTPLMFDDALPRLVCVQLGVRQTRITRAPLAVPAADADVDRWDVTFPTGRSSEGWAQRVQQEIRRLAFKNRLAIVISAPGVVDERDARVLFSPNLRWSEGIDFRKLFGKAVHVRQEIRALAMGQLATRPGMTDFLLVDFGSGMGAAAVTSGALYAGPLPLSGEIGHTPVLGNERKCSCGAIGCLETMISAPGLLRTAADVDEKVDVKDWPQLVEKLAAAARPPAWLKRSLDACAVAVACSMNMMGQRQAVLTGAMNDLPAGIKLYLADAIRSDSMWARFGEIDVRFEPRRRLAGLIRCGIEAALLDA